jgi:hypothetical protein
VVQVDVGEGNLAPQVAQVGRLEQHLLPLVLDGQVEVLAVGGPAAGIDKLNP